MKEGGDVLKCLHFPQKLLKDVKKIITGGGRIYKLDKYWWRNMWTISKLFSNFWPLHIQNHFVNPVATISPPLETLKTNLVCENSFTLPKVYKITMIELLKDAEIAT